METKTKENKNQLIEKDIVIGKRGASLQKIRLGAAEYSKMIDQEMSSDDRDSEDELDLPQTIGVSLNLSKQKIKKISESLLGRMNSVQYLYLEGNRLTELPKLFFQNLQNLKWLDLRNNRLTCLPTAGLKNHSFLEFILLQGNRIRNLPVELGVYQYYRLYKFFVAMVASLKGLQTSGNPITNVPYEVIAEGFHGLIKHLQKLLAQEEILLPGRESVVVQPSITKGNPESSKLFLKKPSETDSKIWNLDELSQWRQFMKQKSKKIYNADNKCDLTKVQKQRAMPQPKISVSVRSQPKTALKFKPFRCGIYNKNSRKTTLNASHFLKMRKTRLGYRRRPITLAMLQGKAQKEAFNSQVRETLEKQAKKIQRMKDKETLKSWRDHARFTHQQMKLLDNFQQYPSKNFASKIPFDVDPEFLSMLNRVDIYRSLKEYDNKYKRITIPKTRISALDLERQMNEIMEKLQKLDTNVVESDSPRTKHKHVCDKMHKIIDIQKTLKNLQTLNSSTSGIISTSKSKPKTLSSKN